MQLYAQPFISSVGYSGFKAFNRARAFEFLTYGTDGASTIAYDPATRLYRADADGAGPAPTATFPNPDFRFRSFRANLVTRWEYRPGSAVYFAWAHGRDGFEPEAHFDVAGNLRSLRDDESRNRLLIKASFWFNP